MKIQNRKIIKSNTILTNITQNTFYFIFLSSFTMWTQGAIVLKIPIPLIVPLFCIYRVRQIFDNKITPPFKQEKTLQIDIFFAF